MCINCVSWYPPEPYWKLVLIDLDLQGHLGLKRSKLVKKNPGIVHEITHHVFKLRSPNLPQLFILVPSRTLGVDCLWPSRSFGAKIVQIGKKGFVRMITRHVFVLGSPNVHQLRILLPSRTLLKIMLIDHYLQGHLGQKRSRSDKIRRLWTITFEGWKLRSPNLVIC